MELFVKITEPLRSYAHNLSRNSAVAQTQTENHSIQPSDFQKSILRSPTHNPSQNSAVTQTQTKNHTLQPSTFPKRPIRSKAQNPSHHETQNTKQKHPANV
jgi:hypothetical protein